ncbi:MULTISPECIES: hypothetical protein [Streptomyces]|uniref:Uncharacterized protein n=1 Tax=Streptomyces griseus subsp. griseus (strain JCM 4626 / CBS 651.72 / NBRC 13350 / KCC S-0626 / ISP 5235) TaxID=455632 RepID=B1VT39_STRGG|nr:hypothetical protein [Streptomyces griseus]MBW3703397.1 hypothetical protein [Streptomyces griseus]NEB51346.1 hypothetical protein [Streptomyces griseus]SED67007.1 hypothetical protein SAMN04490359_1351 [Streptomyces griseus]SQA24287.1 Uncharacterised protein [Streptomyces griseus]BAG17743.1 hypothetical protein SGR_914 [Streptomyces griseus subsp. griseus NBRC 13350]
MWESAIAVIGTLAGGLLVTITQQVTDRRQQREHHRERVADLTGQLLSAALRYRQLYWLRVDALRAGEPDPVARADFYQARSDVTEARDRLALTVTDETLLRASGRAAWSALDLSDIDPGLPEGGRYAPEIEARLDEARERSREAHTALRQAATGYGNPSAPGSVVDSRSQSS